MSTEASSSTTSTRYATFEVTDSQLHNRQVNSEHGATAKLASHRKFTAMVLNDAFHNPKSQAGAFFSLGGDKRLENRPDHLRGNAGTGIGYQNPHPSMEIILPRNMAGANHQFASIGHGILGVDDQVREPLADLVGSDDCVRQTTQIFLDLHVGALELSGQML